MALTSLAVALVLCVYWWRSNHGHADSFTLGGNTTSQSHFIAQHGRIVLEVTDHIGNTVVNRLEFYSFQNAIGICTFLPAIWLAIKVRSVLPRPPGMGKRL